MINLSLVAHGQNTVQSLARITFPVQTLICTAPNPRMCGDGYLDNEGSRSGLAVSSAYPTHSQTLPSPPNLCLYKCSQGGCSSLPLSTTGRFRYVHMMTPSAQKQINPLPLLTVFRGPHWSVWPCFLGSNFRFELHYGQGFHLWAFATAEVLLQWFREEKNNIPENLFAKAEISLQSILL